MTREHMPHRFMKQFKAFILDYEYYLSLSNEPQSVCLTERQMYVLSVQNSYTYWLTRWYNTEDTSASEVAAIAAEIDGLLMCGCGVPEPSITDRFTTNNYIGDTTEIYETTYNTWSDNDQTIVSIAPNLDRETGDPDLIDKLFCLAFKMLVVTLTQTAISQSNQNASGKRDIVKATGAALGGLSAAGGLAIGVGGGAAALVGLAGGPITLLGLAIAGVAVAFSSLFIQADNSAYEDTEAINAVANTMYCNTKGSPMTQSAFAGSLEPNEFVAGSHEAKIAAVVTPFIQDVTVYLNFLTIMNQYYEAVNFGVMPECDDCPEPEPTLTLQTHPGWEHFVPTFVGFDDDDNEIWDITRFANTGYATALVFDPHHSFLFMSEDLVSGSWTTQVAYTTYPGGVWTENFSNHIPDDVEMTEFMRVVSGVMPNVWRVHLKYMGTH